MLPVGTDLRAVRAYLGAFGESALPIFLLGAQISGNDIQK